VLDVLLFDEPQPGAVKSRMAAGSRIAGRTNRTRL
jgi:hypothetical protein